MTKPPARRRLRGIPDDFDFQRNLYTIVGHTVVTFGMLDFAIDMLVGMLVRDFPDHGKTKIPHQFSERLAFITKCATELKELGRYAGALNRISAEADRVAMVRNDVVHGYPANYRKSDHLITFAKAQIHKQQRSVQIVKLRDITAQPLLQVGLDTADLVSNLSSLNLRLAAYLDRRGKRVPRTNTRSGTSSMTPRKKKKQ